jgi:stearoyl-CoA desaturase (delta-9 desaturase)
MVRMFLVHHVSFAINSVAHSLGEQPYATGDRSRNNPFLAVISLGEGWHNNHHAFPASARFGLRPRQLDVGAWLIAVLETLRLAHTVKRPSPEALLRRSGPKEDP